jgi:hypothetical protein
MVVSTAAEKMGGLTLLGFVCCFLLRVTCQTKEAYNYIKQ